MEIQDYRTSTPALINQPWSRGHKLSIRKFLMERKPLCLPQRASLWQVGIKHQLNRIVTEVLSLWISLVTKMRVFDNKEFHVFRRLIKPVITGHYRNCNNVLRMHFARCPAIATIWRNRRIKPGQLQTPTVAKIATVAFLETVPSGGCKP